MGNFYTWRTEVNVAENLRLKTVLWAGQAAFIWLQNYLTGLLIFRRLGRRKQTIFAKILLLIFAFICEAQNSPRLEETKL